MPLIVATPSCVHACWSQIAARMQLCDMATALLAKHEALERGTADAAQKRDELLYGPPTTVAQRLVLAHQDWSEPACVRAISGAQVSRKTKQLSEAETTPGGGWLLQTH